MKFPFICSALCLLDVNALAQQQIPQAAPKPAAVAEPVAVADPAAVLKARQDQWRFAEGLFLRRFFADAEHEYELLVQAKVTDAMHEGALLRLAECAEKLKKPESQLAWYVQYAKEGTNARTRNQVILRQAELLKQLKKTEKLLELYRSVDVSHPDLKQIALYQQGRLELEQKTPKLAYASFTKVLELDKDKQLSDAEAYSTLALAAMDRADAKLDGAVAHYRRLLASPGAGQSWRFDSMAALVQVLRAQAKHKEAIALYGNLLKFSKNAAYSDVVLLMASSMLDTGAYKQAADALTLLQGLAPKQEAQRLYSLAFAHYNQQQWKLAVDLFEKSLKSTHCPAAENAAAFAVFARYHFDVPGCLASSLAYVKKYPKSKWYADVMYLAASCADSAGKRAQARQLMETLLKTYPAAWSRADELYVNLAQVYAEAGEFNLSAKLYRDLAGRRKQGLARSQALLQAARYYLAASEGESAEQLALQLINDKKTDVTILAPARLLYLDKLMKGGRDVDVLAAAETMSESALALDKPALLYRACLAAYRLKKVKKAQELALKLWPLLGKQANEGDMLVLVAAVAEQAGNNQVAADRYAQFFNRDLKAPAWGLGPQRRFQLSSFLNLNGHSLAALKALDSVVVKAGVVPTQQQVDLQRGRVLARAGRYKQLAASVLALLEAHTYEKDKRAQSILLTLMAEALLMQGQKGASLTFYTDKATEVSGLALADVCRLHWVKAEVALLSGDFKNALRAASRVYILHDDALYTPRALVVALAAAAESAQLEKAKKILVELKKRYPEALLLPNLQNILKKHAL